MPDDSNAGPAHNPLNPYAEDNFTAMTTASSSAFGLHASWGTPINANDQSPYAWTYPQTLPAEPVMVEAEDVPDKGDWPQEVPKVARDPLPEVWDQLEI